MGQRNQSLMGSFLLILSDYRTEGSVHEMLSLTGCPSGGLDPIKDEVLGPPGEL